MPSNLAFGPIMIIGVEDNTSLHNNVDAVPSISTDYGLVLVLPTVKHKYTICLCASVFIISITAYWFSWSFSMMVLGSSTLGVCLVRTAYGLNFQRFLRSSRKQTANDNGKSTIKSCGVCLTPNCERHVDFGNENSFNCLWHSLKVPSDVDEAVEDFLKTALNKYLFLFLRDISENDSFRNELCLGIRCALSNLLRRAEKIYLPNLITRKLLRTALFHVDCCLQASLKRDERGGSEGVIFDYYGSDLHVAVFNRESEVRYLRGLTQKILPYLVPSGFLESSTITHLIHEILSGPILMSTMDTIADPDIINSFLLVIFDRNPIIKYPPDNRPQVIFLEKFASWPISKMSTKLSEEMSFTKVQKDYLYALMQFMKREQTIRILQFCLAIDEFSARLLNPELTDNDLRSLHSEAKSLYDMYISPNGSDKLNFDQCVIEEFKSIVEGSYKDITKLQSTEPLYQAHEYSFKLLEKHLPDFLRSFEYFEQLCGSKTRILDRKSTLRRTNKNISTAARIGNKINKIRGALMPTSAIDGSIDEYAAELADEADELKLGMDIDVNGEIDDLSVRDLSAWRVSIPKVLTKKDERNKPYYVYIIEIHRIDIKNKEDLDEFNWTVERQFHEFYVLEAKLTEFHGDSVDIHLPSKRSFGNKGHDYMESKRPALEEFLQRLLQKPVFRGSELLFTFLSSTGDFTKSLLPDINFGRIIKNVPMKLVKEKGQHLESFLQSFISSTDSIKPKQNNKVEYKEFYFQPSSIARKLRKSEFGDNAGRRLDVSPLSTVRLKSVLHLDGLCDGIMYLGIIIKQNEFLNKSNRNNIVLSLVRPVFKKETTLGWSLSLLIAFLKGIGIPFETFIENYLRRQLQQTLVPKRISNWVKLLKEVIFIKDIPKRSNADKALLSGEALLSAKNFLPRLLINFIGVKHHDIGMETLFDILQHPRLNKQLSYTILDVIALELFPELEENEMECSNINYSGATKLS